MTKRPITDTESTESIESVIPIEPSDTKRSRKCGPFKFSNDIYADRSTLEKMLSFYGYVYSPPVTRQKLKSFEEDDFEYSYEESTTFHTFAMNCIKDVIKKKKWLKYTVPVIDKEHEKSYILKKLESDSFASLDTFEELNVGSVINATYCTFSQRHIDDYPSLKGIVLYVDISANNIIFFSRSDEDREITVHSLERPSCGYGYGDSKGYDSMVEYVK